MDFGSENIYFASLDTAALYPGRTRRTAATGMMWYESLETLHVLLSPYWRQENIREKYIEETEEWNYKLNVISDLEEKRYLDALFSLLFERLAIVADVYAKSPGLRDVLQYVRGQAFGDVISFSAFAARTAHSGYMLFQKVYSVHSLVREYWSTSYRKYFEDLSRRINSLRNYEEGYLNALYQVIREWIGRLSEIYYKADLMPKKYDYTRRSTMEQMI